MKIISATALLIFLPIGLLLAQTEVAPPPEDLVPRQQTPEAEEVDEKSRQAADDALNNFRSRAEDQGVDVDSLQEQARGALEGAGVTEEDVEEVGRRIRDAARGAGVTDEDVDQVNDAVNDRLDRAEEGGAVATEDEVEAALKALEELGAQAERALEDEQEENLVIDDMADQNSDETTATATADDEPILPADDSDILNDTAGASDPREYPAIAGGGDPSQQAMDLANSIMDEETLQQIEQRRQEIFADVNAERDAKNAKISFRKAWVRASSEPEIAVLKEYADEAATESEKRAFLRQYYVELFNKIRQLEPGIEGYILEREKVYIDRIDRVERGNDPAPVQVEPEGAQSL